MLKIAMYHYVRNLKLSRFPLIKGLDFSNFIEQIEHISKQYNCITIQDLLGFYEEGEQLPPNAILLTFDDGYKDHFDYVFPVLDKYNMQGIFFTPVRSITQKEVLDVNKIHHVLATEVRSEVIIEAIKKYYHLEFLASNGELPDFKVYEAEELPSSRFDTKEVMFIKTILQWRLPLNVRSKIINKLFSSFVTDDETAFAEELYLNEWQLKCMLNNNMIIGSHSYDHFWLANLDKNAQIEQIEKSTNFLLSLGVPKQSLCIGYPYGSYNQSLLDVVSGFGYKLGFSTKVDTVDLNVANPLALPRLDTNDFYPIGNN